MRGDDLTSFDRDGAAAPLRHFTQNVGTFTYRVRLAPHLAVGLAWWPVCGRSLRHAFTPIPSRPVC